MPSSKKSRPIAIFRHSLTVEVFEPEFKLSPSLRFINVDALSKSARAEIPIGEVDGGCCQHTVYATIRKGMVVGIRAEECPKEERMTLTREYAAVVAQAMKRLQAKRRRGGHKFPMPVATFFRNRSIALAASIDVLVCVRICILGFCSTCCRVVTTPNSPIICGRVTIDTTKPG